MPSPRQASYEILADVNIAAMADEETTHAEYKEAPRKSNAGLITTIILAIMAAPIALPFSITAVILFFALLLVVASVLFALFISTFGVAGASVYEIIRAAMAGLLQPVDILYYGGIFFLAVGCFILLISAVQGITRAIKRSLIRRRERKAHVVSTQSSQVKGNPYEEA